MTSLALAVRRIMPTPPRPVGVKAVCPPAVDMEEYKAVAKKLGVGIPKMYSEKFLSVMEGLNFPIYDLQSVIRFMDAKALKEGNGHGWQWKPLRQKDYDLIRYVSWGQECRENGSSRKITKPASDFYAPNHVSLYDKPVPLHALKKIEAIESSEVGSKVAFMVSDYTTKPHVVEDPFLMAVISEKSSEQLRKGEGRFVIDVWDEPGFGIMEMVK